ncbi:hypothetical protein [Natronococcus sp. JC468]|nr:hypothetical protein [Natronococcus sp. JC468]
MNELTAVVLETETALPMDVVGWGVLLVSLAVTIAWMTHLYR